ncbi:MAG: pyruvate dehydrogenase (acetyl-transferring) E1 component subunit alpha [Proteobacteria bacterium]|nr:pyruvate dehydrogenase (acetyl-transferring) E1 component subunit alpha [Pseudomonadota bacterium]
MPLKEVAKFSVSQLQVLDEHGQLDEKLDPRLSAADAVRLYEAMSLGREVDQRLVRLQRQGRMGTCPPCTGHEAAVCAPALAMTDRDWFVGYYRELGARLMRGDSLEQSLHFWHGHEEGNVQQQPGRTLPVTAIVGAQVPHAVGIAYAMKYRREQDSAVVSFFGDGATSQGDVHEAMNFAAVWQVPVVFICVNNQWAISHPREQQTRSETIAQKAIAYGFEGLQVDGNDPLGMYLATDRALQRAREGGGPTLIEALTYRLLMHTTADDPRRYRSDAEVERWWKRDPLPRMRRYLEGRALWGEAQQEALQERMRQQIDAAVNAAEQAGGWRPDVLFDHVYGTPDPEIEAQRRSFLGSLPRAGAVDGHGA